MFFKIFGSNPSGKHLERTTSSQQYYNTGFKNLSETPVITGHGSMLKTRKEYFNKSKNIAPGFVLPSVKTDLKNIQADKAVIVWFGHSAYFIRINNKNILVDPVFSGRASPFSFMVKSFVGEPVILNTSYPNSQWWKG